MGDVDRVVETLREQQKAESRARRGKELRLWHDWHEAGRPAEKLTPLLQSIHPLIRGEATKRLQGLGGSIPRSALENELRVAATQALHSYDPSKGVQLSTHVVGNFRRINDFVSANRNLRHMPREATDAYATFHNTVAELHEELGHPPSTVEIQQRAPGIKPTMIKRMQRGFSPEVYTDMGAEFESAHERMTPRDTFMLMRSTLKPVEVQFGEALLPPEGNSPPVKQIAKNLGISTSRAFHLKKKLEKRLGTVFQKE